LRGAISTSPSPPASAPAPCPRRIAERRATLLLTRSKNSSYRHHSRPLPTVTTRPVLVVHTDPGTMDCRAKPGNDEGVEREKTKTDPRPPPPRPSCRHSRRFTRPLRRAGWEDRQEGAPAWVGDFVAGSGTAGQMPSRRHLQH